MTEEKTYTLDEVGIPRCSGLECDHFTMDGDHRLCDAVGTYLLMPMRGEPCRPICEKWAWDTIFDISCTAAKEQR